MLVVMGDRLEISALSIYSEAGVALGFLFSL